MEPPEELAHRLIDENRYLTLATADRDGAPWVTPLWFAHLGYQDFIWVSKQHRRHTRNLRQRPEVSFVIYDSTQEPGDARAVFGRGRAAETAVPEHRDAFNRRSRDQGLPEWSLARLSGDAPFRLFHLVAEERWILDEHEDRIPLAHRRGA